jgi:hypothetical protein
LNSHSVNLCYQAGRDSGSCCDQTVDQCGNTASYHQSGNHCAELGFAGSSDEPVAVLESNADLAECFVVSALVASAEEAVQPAAEKH